MKIFEQNHKFVFKFKKIKIIINKAPSDQDYYPFAKALVFALYHRQYPSIRVEAKVDERFQPDLSAFDVDGATMIFWAEVGKVSLDKIEKLFKKYRKAHFVFVREAKEIEHFRKQLDKMSKDIPSLPLVEIIPYPEKFHEWNVSEEGDVFIKKEDVEIITWNEPKGLVKYY